MNRVYQVLKNRVTDPQESESHLFHELEPMTVIFLKANLRQVASWKMKWKLMVRILFKIRME